MCQSPVSLQPALFILGSWQQKRSNNFQNTLNIQMRLELRETRVIEAICIADPLLCFMLSKPQMDADWFSNLAHLKVKIFYLSSVIGMANYMSINARKTSRKKYLQVCFAKTLQGEKNRLLYMCVTNALKGQFRSFVGTPKWTQSTFVAETASISKSIMDLICDCHDWFLFKLLLVLLFGPP